MPKIEINGRDIPLEDIRRVSRGNRYGFSVIVYWRELPFTVNGDKADELIKLIPARIDPDVLDDRECAAKLHESWNEM